MNNKRRVFVGLFILIIMFSLVGVTACNSAQRPGPEQPTPSPPTPIAPQKDTTQAQVVAEKVSDLDNVNSATVVLSENTAWVGVDLAAHLKNKLTNELKNEITSLVKKEDKKIETVFVTADVDTVTRLRNIARDVANGEPLSGFMEELNEMGRRITPSAK